MSMCSCSEMNLVICLTLNLTMDLKQIGAFEDRPLFAKSYILAIIMLLV